MKISTYALALALGGFTLAMPALSQPIDQTRNTQTTIRGQSGGAVSKSEEKTKEQREADKLSSGRKLELSKEARNAIVDLQNAVNANDTATIPAKLAKAQSLAKTTDDKYIIAVYQTKAATAAVDLAGMRAGIDALRASGGADPADLVARYNNLGKRYYDAKQLDLAAGAFEQSLAVDSNNGDAMKMLASLRDAQGRKGDAVALMAKSLMAAKATGGKPKESDYKFAARIAYDAKSPVATQITQGWLADYPNATNWRDALRIYRDVNGLDGIAKLDVMRLARAANALNGEGDYFGYVNELVIRGYLGEAKAVVAEGGAKKAIDVNKNAFKQFAPKFAKAPSRAVIDAAAKAALAGKSGQPAMEAGDTLYGVGAFAEAVPLYKAAAAKGGIDANLVNLHLGMALARAGDKAGATAALKAVTGAQANTAKYWLIWVNGQA
jgi:tetratricopeptide (TPR) repeat protein